MGAFSLETMMLFLKPQVAASAVDMPQFTSEAIPLLLDGQTPCVGHSSTYWTDRARICVLGQHARLDTVAVSRLKIMQGFSLEALSSVFRPADVAHIIARTLTTPGNDTSLLLGTASGTTVKLPATLQGFSSALEMSAGRLTPEEAAGMGHPVEEIVARKASNVRVCASCGKCLAHWRRCSRCKSVWYCDKACQTANWATHRGHCASDTSLAS